MIPDTYRCVWERDCWKWRGEILNGAASHWCSDWDELPIDELCQEFPCACYAGTCADSSEQLFEMWERMTFGGVQVDRALRR